MSREKARDQNRFEVLRRQRLEEAGVLSARDNDEEPLVEYMPDEIVTVAGSADLVGQELDRLGDEWRRRDDPGLRDDPEAPVIIECSGDPRDVIRRLNGSRSGRGETELLIAPNHVLSIARTRIGPGSDPWPAKPSERSGPGPTFASQAPAIGIVDTGLWEPMPAAVSIADPGGANDEDPVDTTPPPRVIDYPGAGHGGFIAGVITHTAKGIDIVSRRGYRTGSQDIITEDSVVRAGDDLVGAGPRIINLSLGTYAGEVIFLRDAVLRWVGAGCLVVAAAGNDHLSRPWYPAGFAADPELAHGVVSVGALETRVGDGPGILAAPAPFSNYGPWVTAWAPGADVVSEYPDGQRFPYDVGDLSAPFDDGLAHWDGTSFAAPFVAAEIARYAADHGFGDDVQRAWKALRGESPFVVFWPSWDGDNGEPTRGR